MKKAASRGLFCCPKRRASSSGRRHLNVGRMTLAAFEFPAGAKVHVLGQADTHFAQVFAVAIDTDPARLHARIGRKEGRFHVGWLDALSVASWKIRRDFNASIGLAKR